MSLSAQPCLGYVESDFLSVSALLADAMLKVADLSLLGMEPNGAGGLCIRLAASSPASLEAGFERAEQLAAELGTRVTSVSLAAPDPQMTTLNEGPLTYNPLYGGREEFLPTDFNPNWNDPMKQLPALGILETQGLTASLAASDTMLKTASVELVGKEKIGAAYVTIMIRGDVAAVKAAIEAGASEAAAHGKVIAAHTIARPHEDMAALLP